MPCDNIDEGLVLRLNQRDELVSYTLAKRTCGALIGEASLLLPWLERRPMEKIVALSSADLARALQPDSDQEFLYLKHLFALQEALRAYRGEAPCGPKAAFQLGCVGFGEDSVDIEGWLQVTALTEQIRSCGGCGSCGKHR